MYKKKENNQTLTYKESTVWLVAGKHIFACVSKRMSERTDSWSKATNTQIKALFSAWDHVCVCVFACFLSYFDFLFTTFCSSSLKKKKKKFWTMSSRLFQQLPQITVIIFVKTSSVEKSFKSKSKENIKPNLNVKNEVGFSDPVIQYQRHQ